MYANHGALQKHHHLMEGINSRMDGLQAAVLSAKLPHILEWTRQRIRVAGWYNKYLTGIIGISLPKLRPDSKHTYHLYVIVASKREELKDYLGSRGIDTQIHYPTPLPFLPAYRYLGASELEFPVAKKLQPEILSLPIYPEMTEEMVGYVAEQIRTFYS